MAAAPPGWTRGNPPGGVLEEGGFGMPVGRYEGRQLQDTSALPYIWNVQSGSLLPVHPPPVPPLAPHPVRVGIEETLNFNSMIDSTHPGFGLYSYVDRPTSAAIALRTDNSVPALPVQSLAMPGFPAGAYVPPAPGQKTAIGSPAGLDRRHLYDTIAHYHNGLLTTPAHRRDYLSAHNTNGELDFLSLAKARGLTYNMGRIFIAHALDYIYNNQAVQDLRDQASAIGAELSLQMVGFTVKPNPVEYWNYTHRILDPFARTMLDIFGTSTQPATRESWDGMGLNNVVAAFMGGADPYNSPTIYRRAFPHERLMFADESGSDHVNMGVNMGFHMHGAFITYRLSKVGHSEMVSPSAQIGWHRLNQFFEKRAYGSFVMEMPESPGAASRLKSLATYWQNVDPRLEGQVRYLAYALMGKDESSLGKRHRQLADQALLNARLRRPWFNHYDEAVPWWNRTQAHNAGVVAKQATGRTAGIAFLPHAHFNQIPDCM